jgi:hypothetical protein
MEQETLALVYTLTKYRHYFYGCIIDVFTDHQAMIDLVHGKSLLTGRRARWVNFLNEFQLSVHYRKGSRNFVAETLSRRCDLNNISVIQLDKFDYQKDPYFRPIVSYFCRRHIDEEPPPLVASVIHWFSWQYGFLYFIRDLSSRRLCVPLENQTTVIKDSHHFVGHSGMMKTLAEVQRNYF